MEYNIIHRHLFLTECKEEEEEEEENTIFPKYAKKPWNQIFDAAVEDVGSTLSLPLLRGYEKIVLNSRMSIIREGNGLTGCGEEAKRMRREQSGERITLSKKTTSKRAGDNTGIQLLTSVNASVVCAVEFRHISSLLLPASRPLPPELSRIRDEKYVLEISIDFDGIPFHFRIN